MDLVFSESKVYEYILDKEVYKVEAVVKVYWNKKHKISYVHLSLEGEATKWLEEDLISKYQLTESLEKLFIGQKLLEFQYSSADAIRRAIELFDTHCQAVIDGISHIGRDEEKLVETID